MCRAIQKIAFSEEYRALNGDITVGPSNRLLPLAPFIDGNGLLRVGGRLKNSGLSADARRPILLLSQHELMRRLIVREHVHNTQEHRLLCLSSGSNFGLLHYDLPHIKS